MMSAAPGVLDTSSKLDIERAIRPELSSGERLIWSGRPRLGMVLRGSDALAIPFSLLWGGFAIFWEATVIMIGHAPWFFRLWGIPFVLVGLYLIVGRFFVDSAMRAHTYYAVTDQRILIVSGRLSRHVKTLSRRAAEDMSLTEKADKSGTITFGPSTFPMMFNPWGAAWPGSSRRMVPMFEMIENARAVYDIIRNSQQLLS